MSFETIDEKLKSSIFFVECNSFEHMCLWDKFHKETKWEEDGEGILKTIGLVCNHKNKPVALHFTFAKLYNQRICFYDITSRFVDYTMIDKYIDDNYANKEVLRISATHFDRVVNCCKEKKINSNA